MPRRVGVAIPEQRSVGIFNRSGVEEVRRPRPMCVESDLAQLPLHLEGQGVELRLAIVAINSDSVELRVRPPGSGPRDQACRWFVDADAVVQVVVVGPDIRQAEAYVLVLPLQRDIPLPDVAVL